VLLGAGEVLQGRAEGLGRHHAEVDLEVVRAADAHPGFAPLEHGGGLGPASKPVHDRRRVFAIDHDVEVTHRLPAAPPASGSLDLPGRRTLAQPREQVARDVVGLLPEKPRMARIHREGDVAEDRGLGLRPEPLEPRHAFLAACRLEFLEGCDAELIDERLGLLGSESRHPHQFEGHRRHPGLQFVEQR